MSSSAGALAVLGVLIPPVAVLIDRGCGGDFIINLILTILLVWVGGILHAFHIFGVGVCTNICNLLLPPLGTFLNYGIKLEFWICLLLTILGWFPGAIYAYYVSLKGVGSP